MKRNKNKRIWNDLLLAACLLLLCIFLACGGFGMLKPAQAESGDPYDWTDYAPNISVPNWTNSRLLPASGFS